MTPVYIDGCFGILHPASASRGVLICGPLSDEALNCHRALVFLGEHLAEAGFPALRLACRGTGDSAGDDTEPDRFAQWLASITAGVQWLRQECGVTSITLIGHRIGAALAARAACELDCVDSLVMLAPIGGRQFLHELTLAGKLSQRIWKTSHPLDDGTWFESHGLRIDHATRDALNRLDLRRLPALPAERILVIDQSERMATRTLVEALQKAGAHATLAPYDRLDAMQRDSYEAEVPRTAFAQIRGWMQSLPTHPASAGEPRTGWTASLPVAAGRETPIRFGPNDGLFGILCQPDQPSDTPALLIANTSANPRAGNARIAVEIARSLAADGVMSLRMDASGMGDADPQTGERGRPYSEAVTADVLAAAAELERRSGRPVVVLGICSGAYHALQATARDARIAGMVLVNLQRFVWNEGDPSDVIRRTALRPNSFYVRSIFNLQSWQRLIRADFDVANLLLVFTSRLVRRAAAELDPVLHLVSRRTTRVGGVRRMLRGLTQRGVAVLYVLGCNDPGIEELAEYFGPGGRRLRRQKNVTLVELADADHTLGGHPVRQALIGHVHAWFRQRWPEGAAVTNPLADDRTPRVLVAAGK